MRALAAPPGLLFESTKSNTVGAALSFDAWPRTESEAHLAQFAHSCSNHSAQRQSSPRGGEVGEVFGPGDTITMIINIFFLTACWLQRIAD